MSTMHEGSLLWQPSASVIEQANLTAYRRWVNHKYELTLNSYADLWRWSVDHLETFWASLFDYFGLITSQPWTMPLVSRTMPGAQWFPSAQLNYVENIFHRQPIEAEPNAAMVYYKAEDAPLLHYTRTEIVEQVRRLAAALDMLGVRQGDRVVAFIPNIPQAMIALFATASLGAIWSSCSPDFGSRSVLDRFFQIEPKILIAVDGYQYNGKYYNRSAEVAELQAALPSLTHTIILPFQQDSTALAPHTLRWDTLLAEASDRPLTFAQVPFDHPLWILYSSGTTGLPKPIVQSHGGILLEHIKATVFHNDLKPADRFFWYSSTGWMMWNYLIGSLLSGASIILYNGSPNYPNMNILFELAEQTGMTYFGTSAAFINACIKAHIQPNQHYDLSHIRGVGSTGSPLSIEGFQWIYDHINRDLALESLSGGTDLCTAIVGGARILPIYAGEIQGASLGANVQAFNEEGQPIINAVGELVITEPMPSMPIYFWNDAGMQRYQDSYFDTFPHIWRHGDWISFNARGGCVIYGRSDATINRYGIRMGTTEIYRVVESFDAVLDSLVIDLEMLGKQSYMPLFVVLREGYTLDDALKNQIVTRLRQEISPRHAPDDIFQIKEIPYTLSGKKMEIPIRKILLGMDVSKTLNPGAMRNPESLEYFYQLAKQRNHQP